MEGELSFTLETSSVLSQEGVRIYRQAKEWDTRLHTSVQNIL